MSSERKEIRWKFQILSDTLAWLLQISENEKRAFQEKWEKFDRGLTEIRNNLLAGIGFSIAIFISLISIGAIEDQHSWYVIIGLIAGIVVFVGVNGFLNKKYQSYFLVEEKFNQTINEFIWIRGYVSGKAFDEKVTNDDIILLTGFITILGSALTYELQNFAHNIMKFAKPNQDQFRENYLMAKNNLEKFRKINLPQYFQRIELFIKVFEKNEKPKN